MKNPELIMLVDGNAILHRAYHAFPKELATPQGEPIGAVYGFTRILLSTVKNLKPHSVAVCFDLKGPTFRHQAFDGYKATRQKMPDDLASQVQRAHQIVEFLEFPIYAAEGFEADDCLGTIAKQACLDRKENCRIVIVTGDRDILQLVNDQVSVLIPGSYPKPSVTYTPQTVREQYGFSPEQMIEYKALRGDPSDNIPGVEGVGEVTATKLIQEFGSVDKLYQSIESSPTPNLKPALREKLITQKDNAFLSRELARIHQDAPVKFNSGLCRLELKEPRKLIDLFQELGFKSLIKELPTSHKLLSEAEEVFNPGSNTSQPNPDPPAEKSRSEKIDEELAPVLRKMEEIGVKVDLDYLKGLETEYTRELAELKRRLFDFAGSEFNPDSPIQVGHILYEKLSIPTAGIRKGKNGFTTDAATLTDLAKDYPITQLLLDYRELMKLQSTYVKPLQELADTNARVHTSYAPDTSTGRLSSKNPNLQNIPIRSEEGRRIRRAFIAKEGCILVSADYSQIELRIAADLSGDLAMKEIFQAGRDFHAETAARMGVDRRIAKIINFSILYGKGAYGFSKDMGISVEAARRYIEQYYQTFKGLRVYLDQLLTTAKKQGFLDTIFGRRRYFPDLHSSNFQRRSAAEREAINLPIQGTAADILKLAMCNLAAKLKESESLILTVHDELVLEIPEQDLARAAEILSQTMSQAVKLSVPLEVSVKSGPNWEQMEEIKT